MTRTRLIPCLAVWACMPLFACDQAWPKATLEGQWAIKLEAAAETKSSVPVEGVLVFSRDLPRYPNEKEEFPRQAEIGRAFVPIRNLGVESSADLDGRFTTYAGADHAETIWGHISRNDSVLIDLAPNVNDFDPYLRGKVVSGTIIGEWSIRTAGAANRRGRFVMTRIPRDAWSDSARVRAQRGVNRWNSD